jgi:hypothetical protein
MRRAVLPDPLLDAQPSHPRRTSQNSSSELPKLDGPGWGLGPLELLAIVEKAVHGGLAALVAPDDLFLESVDVVVQLVALF